MSVVDPSTRRWVEHLRVGHPARERAIAQLHELLQRVAVAELSRRRYQLGLLKGPEFDDVAQQAADDATIKLLQRLDEFRGLSRFTTWAYKFVIFEVSGKVARHAWRRQPPGGDELLIDRLADFHARQPQEWLDERAQLHALRRAIDGLTERQREVFVAVALNDVPIDVVAARLQSNPNAIYKNLFDARHNLRAWLRDAGHPVGATSRDEIAGSRNVPHAGDAACSA